jgi:PAS domain S-box-containing protein
VAPGIERSSAELARIYRTVPIGICFLDTDLRYVRINERLAALNRLPVEEHIGRSIREVIPDYAPEFEAFCRRVIETGEAADMEFRAVEPEEPGEMRWWSVNFYPLTEDGVVKGVSVVVQEITALKRTRESLAERLRFERLVSAIFASLVEAPAGGVGEVIDSALREVAAFFAVERATLYELSQDGAEFASVYAYAGEGAETLEGGVSALLFPWLLAKMRSGEVIAVSSPDDLPGDAEVDAVTLARIGTRSFVSVPVRAQGALRYVLSLAAVKEHRAWNPELIARVRLIGECFANALSRSTAEETEAELLLFERLLTDISARFVGSSADRVDRDIQDALTQILDFFGADGASLFQWSADGARLILTHFARREEVPRPDLSGLDIIALAPWTARKLRDGEDVNLLVRDLPENAETDMQSLRARSIRAYACIPVFVGGSAEYVVAIAVVREENLFPNHYIPRLRLLGGIFVGALQRRAAIRDLEKAELKYRTVSDFTFDWEYWQGRDGNLLYVSPSCERVTGLAPGQLTENPALLRDIVMSEDRAAWDEHCRAAHREGVSGLLEFRISRRDAGIVWIEHACRPVLGDEGEYLGVRASNRDITGRKRAEAGLQQSEAFLRTVLGSLTDNIAVVDRDGVILTVNEAWLRFARDNGLTHSGSVLPGANYLQPCRRAAREGDGPAGAALQGVLSVLEGKQPRFSMEYSCNSPNVERWFMMSVTPLLRPEGGAVIAHSDITRRRLAEQQARQRERSLAEAQRIAHLGSWDWNIIDNTLVWSDEVYRIFGLRPREFGATYEAFLENVHPDDRRAVRIAVERSLADPAAPYSIQHRVVRPDGSERIVHERGEVVRDTAERAVRMIGTVHDITEMEKMAAESRHLRTELAHLERVGTIGALTAALAHEMNQPLAAILSNAQAAQRLLSAEDPDLDEAQAALRDIVADDGRAGEVIRRLRTMLKKEETRREPLNTGEVARHVVDLVRSEAIIRNVSLSTDIGDLPLVVRGDPVQIQQVILNLLMNAFEAVRNQPVEERRVVLIVRAEGDDGMVASVKDSGPGIARDKLEAAFAPFYTTKSKGMGLGLALCRSIIEAHGGLIWAENPPDGGALVSFRLPLC